MIFLKNKMNLMNSVLRMTAVAFAVALLPVASHATIDTIAVDVGISPVRGDQALILRKMGQHTQFDL